MPEQQPTQLNYVSESSPPPEMIPAWRAVGIGICILVFGVAVAARGLQEIRRAPTEWPAFIESMTAWSGIVPLVVGLGAAMLGLYFALHAFRVWSGR